MIVTRFVAALAFQFTILFAVFIGLIQARPYDDSQLREFLTPPEGCLMPCFMDIRPGVTTADEAVAILEAHEWVEQPLVLEATDGRGVYAITADWSGSQPELLDRDGDLWMAVEDDIIQRIVVWTNIRLGDIWLLLGVPQYGGIIEDSNPWIAYYGAYLDIGSAFSTGQICPIDSIWRLETLWMISDDLSVLDSASGDTMPNDVYAVCRRLMSEQ